MKSKYHNIIERLRLLVKSKQESYSLYKNLLGFYPRQIKLYKQAFSHRSLLMKMGKKDVQHNERLEFLGDAILSAIVSDEVYRHYTKKEEGILTDVRSKIVQREKLNKIALELNLDKFMNFVLPPQTRYNIYGNALEALIGAIYLDQGYEKTKKFVLKKIISPYINFDEILKQDVNFKSKLVEWGQKNRVEISFELLGVNVDEGNNPVFRSCVKIGDSLCGEGCGFSKRESQQQAAQQALRIVKKKDFFKQTEEYREISIEEIK